MITIDQLNDELHGSTPIYFSYMKKDGTMRNAFGTLNPKLIPEEFKIKDYDPTINEHYNGSNLKYFDLEKNGWRSISYDVSLITLFE